MMADQSGAMPAAKALLRTYRSEAFNKDLETPADPEACACFK
jgi:hypothetical protein